MKLDKRGARLAVLLVAVVAMATIPVFAAVQAANAPAGTCPAAQPVTGSSNVTGQINAVTFHDEWNRIWEDHVWYTREAIIDILTKSPNTNATVDRLIMVANDTRDVLRQYYGAQADTFYTQLVAHFTIAAQLATNLRNGADVTALVNDWFANSRNMSMIMQQMNPQFWQFGPVNTMWDTHLNLTIQEATQFFKGQYAASIATFDKIEDQALMMSAMFSNGIMNQFPEKFSNKACVPNATTMV